MFKNFNGIRSHNDGTKIFLEKNIKGLFSSSFSYAEAEKIVIKAIRIPNQVDFCCWKGRTGTYSSTTLIEKKYLLIFKELSFLVNVILVMFRPALRPAWCSAWVLVWARWVTVSPRRAVSTVPPPGLRPCSGTVQVGSLCFS